MSVKVTLPHPRMSWERIIGANIRRLRVERGLSQEEVADRIGIDTSYFGQVERGRRNPTVRVLAKVAAVLDVPLPRLLDQND